MNNKYTIRDDIDVIDKTELNLIEYIVPSNARFNILVIEGNLCLEKLRSRLPKANIVAVTTDKDFLADGRIDTIEYIELDYCEEKLPFAEKYFDYIIAPRALELAHNPQDIASGLGLYLKDTGLFLSSFLNVRHFKILVEMMEGHFYYFCRHMFTKEEMKRLLVASFYKDFTFSAIKKEAPTEVLEKLVSVGFENGMDDLQTQVWLFQAAKSTEEIRLLKSFFTPAVRKKLSRLLHRIEYDVEREKSIKELKDFCEKEGIFPDYLQSFIEMTVIHKERMINLW